MVGLGVSLGRLAIGKAVLCGMPLVKCKECNHDVSTTAKACPNCGVLDFVSDDVKEE